MTCGYRPVPADFVEVFVRVGWSGIERHYRAHWQTIRRWHIICGGEALSAARRDYVKANGYNRRSSGGNP